MVKFSRTEVLTMLLYGIDMAMRPTMSNLFQGEDAWRHYSGLHRGQLAAMQADGLISSEGKRGQSGWAIRLTEAGRLSAIGGRDAPARWSREFDGEWNLLMFDLEAGAGKLRQKLRRWLCSNHFGCLQQSVWITPDPVGDELDTLLDDYRDRADRILVLRSHIATGEKKRNQPAQIAAQAWDFESINARYQDYLDLVKTTQPKRPTPAGARAWISAEQAAWSRAFNKDPLLPSKLLPKNYLGREAWSKRSGVLNNAAQMTVALKAES
jgi:DNA-binding transcriptional regulator PaaX